MYWPVYATTILKIGAQTFQLLYNAGSLNRALASQGDETYIASKAGSADQQLRSGKTLNEPQLLFTTIMRVLLLSPTLYGIEHRRMRSAAGLQDDRITTRPCRDHHKRGYLTPERSTVMQAASSCTPSTPSTPSQCIACACPLPATSLATSSCQLWLQQRRRKAAVDSDVPCSYYVLTCALTTTTLSHTDSISAPPGIAPTAC